MTLAGQKILITGASRGIGKACAERCAAEGAKIVLVARDPKSLDAVRKALPGSGHIAVSADLQNPDESVPEIFRTACADGIKLTGFIHAAGIGTVIPAKMVTLQAMQEIFTVNYFSFMLMVRQFVRKNHSDGGSIVAISSVASVAGWQGLSVYSGSKGALNASIRSLSLELAGRGFRINAVLPSNILTDMLESMTSTLTDQDKEELKKKQPLGFGMPEDVANAASFLINSASKFITGSCMTVDGGYTAI